VVLLLVRIPNHLDMTFLRRLSEYLINKHGNGKAVPPQSGFIDNLYCEIKDIMSSSAILIYPVTHYAEGSLMPILVQKLIFDYIPKKAPFLIRPLLKTVFAQVNKLLVDPQITRNLTMVCSIIYDGTLILMSFRFRLKHISKNQTLLFSRADKSQLLVTN
jgi:hypothetical protein